jgi:hypothetical protein
VVEKVVPVVVCGNKGAVDDREPQPEPRLKFIRPLPKHRGRRRNDDKVDPMPQQQFAQDEAGFDRFCQGHSMQHQYGLLFSGLDGHKAHRRSGHGLADPRRRARNALRRRQ